MVLLANTFTLEVLAQVFKCCWEVELFFKWIKQYLRIKAFYGTSVSAVKSQVWIAGCAYVLVAIVKKELNVDRTMGETLQILSISLCSRKPPFSRPFRSIATKSIGVVVVNHCRYSTGNGAAVTSNFGFLVWPITPSWASSSAVRRRRWWPV